jgi:hypothetical protein
MGGKHLNENLLQPKMMKTMAVMKSDLNAGRVWIVEEIRPYYKPFQGHPLYLQGRSARGRRFNAIMGRYGVEFIKTTIGKT